MEIWKNVYDIFGRLFRTDPLADIEGKDAGVVVGSASPDLDDIRGDPSGTLMSRDSTALVDMQSWIDRRFRYREYERIRDAMPEVDNILTVLADEACVAGSTKVSTPFGQFPIATLAAAKAPGERFLVYAYDFTKGDFVPATAHSPRSTGVKSTVSVVFPDGRCLRVTPDHKMLLRDSTWRAAGDLVPGDHLMPFYRIRPKHPELNSGQFPRILTLKEGWKHERHLMDEWRLGETLEQYQNVMSVIRLIQQGFESRAIASSLNIAWKTAELWLNKYGTNYTEMRRLCDLPDYARVVNIFPEKDIEVYDLSVDVHHNFATDKCIVHNCQSDDDGHIIHASCDDKWIEDEAKYVLREQWDLDAECHSDFKNLVTFGDHFHECVINPSRPSMGVLKLETLPAESMFRLETVRGKVLEFQQCYDMPDYDPLHGKTPWASYPGMTDSSVVRFNPNQIIHVRLGERRKKFYPYGVSPLEPARMPAHMLRLLEDAMLVYRVSRAPERRVIYVDIQNTPGWKVDSVLDRVRDQIKKKKVPNSLGGVGASSMEERWHPPAVDDDFIVPVRGSNTATKIETLQGGANIGEIDDAIYFRRKLYISMNMPPKYGMEEDAQQNRLTLSSRDMQFARFVERLQKPYSKGVKEALLRHFKLKGVAEERLRTLKVWMTPPSDWRRLSRQEVVDAIWNRAIAIKGAQFLSDYDIFRTVVDLDERTAQDFVARMKQQKLEDVKLNVMGQNPTYLNLGNDDEAINKEIGVDATGPNDRLAPPEDSMTPEVGGTPELPPTQITAPEGQAPIEGTPIPEPDREDIEKYDLRIRIQDENRSSDEEVDRGELGEI